jgi:hypothetical protein
MYHRFAGDAGVVQQRLRAQLRHIRKHYRPVRLSSIDEPHGPREIAVTVDDGYLDFATAWPVFREEGIPVTLYAVSGFLDRRLWLWPDLLDYALKSTKLSMLDVPLPDGSRFRGAPNTAFDPIAQALIRSSDQDRRSYLICIFELIRVSPPTDIPAAYAPLEWAQLKRMARGGPRCRGAYSDASDSVPVGFVPGKAGRDCGVEGGHRERDWNAGAAFLLSQRERRGFR